MARPDSDQNAMFAFAVSYRSPLARFLYVVSFLFFAWLQMAVGFQPLRTPTMLSGAPAALVSYCQKHGRAAMCFAAAELPGRRAVPPQQQVGGEGGSSGGSLLFAERSLSCTRKPLGVVAGEAMVSGICGGGGGVEKGSATSSLYI